MKEHTEQFKHHFGYEIFRDGRICSNSHWRGIAHREITQITDEDGYRVVRLSINGVRENWKVHALVAAYFLPPKPSPAHQIRHLDGNKANNCADNLCWGTAKENADDRELHGRTSRGANHSAAIKAGLPKVSKLKGRQLSEAHKAKLRAARRALSLAR